MIEYKAYFSGLLKKTQQESGDALSKAGPSGKERKRAEFDELANRSKPLTEGQSPQMAEVNQLGHAINMNRLRQKGDPLAAKDPGNAISYHQGFDANGAPNMEGAATVVFPPRDNPTVPRQPGKHSLLGGAVRDKDWDRAKDIARRQSASIRAEEHMPIHELYFKTLRNKTNGKKE